MDEINILKWVVDPKVKISKTIQIQEGLLIDLIHEHRLVNRFLNRVAKKPQTWCSKNIKAILINRQILAQQKIQRQNNAINEILKKHSKDFIVIKGISLYLLSGNYESLNLSNYINIFCENIQLLKNTLINQGYKIRRKIKDNHIITLYKDDITFNIYRFLPITSYSNIDDMNTDDNGLLLGSKVNTVTNILTYNHLVNDLITTNKEGLDGLRYPNTTWSAFICCIEIFNKYIASGIRLFGNITLGELADLLLLTNRDDFNQSVFITLIKEFKASDAVIFSGYLLESFFEHNPFFFESMKHPRMSLFPYQLIGESGIWTILNSQDELIYNNIKSIEKKINFNKPSTLNEISINNNQNNGKLPISISTNCEKSVIIINLKIKKMREAHIHTVTIYFGKPFKWVFIDQKGFFPLHSKEIKFEYQNPDLSYVGEYTFKIFLPLETTHFKDEKYILGFIYINQKDYTNNKVETTFYPLKVDGCNEQHMNKSEKKYKIWD